MVTTKSCPAAVVALTLIEFNRTVILGAVVSAATAVVVEPHTEVAGRQTVSVEHLQQQKRCVCCIHVLLVNRCFACLPASAEEQDF